MKTKFTIILIFLMAFSMNGYTQKNDVSKATKAIEEFKKMNPKIAELFNTAYGYAVFPGIGKGAFVVGGAGGKGTVFKGGVATEDCSMSQVTVGFQAGGQKYAEVIFFENAKAYERFVGNNFEFAAQTSAIALKAGVSLDAPYKDGMLIYTKGEGGLMYEASIGGQKFKTEKF